MLQTWHFTVVCTNIMYKSNLTHKLVEGFDLCKSYWETYVFLQNIITHYHLFSKDDHLLLWFEPYKIAKETHKFGYRGPRWEVRIPNPARKLRHIPHPAEFFGPIPHPVGSLLFVLLLLRYNISKMPYTIAIRMSQIYGRLPTHQLKPPWLGMRINFW